MGYQLQLLKTENPPEKETKRKRRAPSLIPIPRVVAVEVSTEAAPVSPLEARRVWELLNRKEVVNEDASS